MKRVFLVFVLFITGPLWGLSLSKEAQQEAGLFNTFLEAAYAQHAGDSNRFSLLQDALTQMPDSSYLKEQLVAEALAADALGLADYYADFIQTAQDDAQAWTVYAMYQWRKGNGAQAIEAYEKALELDPDNEQILSQYIALLAAVDPAKAVTTLKELAQERPSLTPEIFTEIGQIYLYQRRYTNALDSFNKVLELDPASVNARLGRVEVYEKTNQYFLMLHELEELEKIGYVTAQTLSQMGAVFVLVKDMPRAEECFLRAKSLDNSHITAGYFLAMMAEQRGDYAHAINYLRDTRDYSESASKQIQVSYYQRKLNRPQESFDTIKQAYQSFPDNIDAAYLYSVALYERREYAKSARVLAPLVNKYPNNQEVRLQYAFALEGQKRYKLMEEQLSILLEQNPQQAAALNLFAYSLALRNTRLTQAADYAARALAVIPSEISFLDTQAWIFYLQGKYSQAADLLRTIPDYVLEQTPEIAYHAGMIYAANGDVSLARTYLQIAAQGGWKEAAKALKKLP